MFDFVFQTLQDGIFIGRLKDREDPKILGLKKVQVVDINWQK
jgi:hypothetical protein